MNGSRSQRKPGIHWENERNPQVSSTLKLLQPCRGTCQQAPHMQNPTGISAGSRTETSDLAVWGIYICVNHQIASSSSSPLPLRQCLHKFGKSEVISPSLDSNFFSLPNTGLVNQMLGFFLAEKG